MITAPRTRFTLPDELAATEPPEARGLRRDEVRLLVAEGNTVRHAVVRDLTDFLRPGDLLVVNTSATLAAAVDGTRIGRPEHPAVVVHFSTALDDGTWVVELRSAPVAARPILDLAGGERIELAGDAERAARLTLEAPYDASARRLWRAHVDVPGGVARFLERHGRPIAYKYVDRRWPLSAYQTVFATQPGSAEMPSAGRPFSTELVARLAARGVLVAPVLLHAGVSSQDSHESPMAERFEVPESTARLVSWVRATGGRVIAVGTTAVRALESAARPDGTIGAAAGWTEVVLGPDRPAYVVDGLVSGMHAPEASHLLLLEAVAGSGLVQLAYDAALRRRYLWHEFGDLCLLLPSRRPADG